MKGTPSGINVLVTLSIIGIIIVLSTVLQIQDTLNEVLQGTNATLVDQRRLLELIRIMNEYSLSPEARNFLVSYLHLNLNMLPTPEEFRQLVIALQDPVNTTGPGSNLGDFLNRYGGSPSAGGGAA